MLYRDCLSQEVKIRLLKGKGKENEAKAQGENVTPVSQTPLCHKPFPYFLQGLEYRCLTELLGLNRRHLKINTNKCQCKINAALQVEKDQHLEAVSRLRNSLRWEKELVRNVIMLSILFLPLFRATGPAAGQKYMGLS